MAVKIFESEILEKKMLNHNVVNLKFTFPKDFEFKPGQYLSVSRVADGKKLRTPYSIASPNYEKKGEFCIKIFKVGKSSEYLSTLKKGDKIELFGPLGKFVVSDLSKNKDLIFVCNGTGISAFISMIPSLLRDGFKKRIILIKSFRNEDEILYDKKFYDLSKKYKNFHFYNVLSQPKNKDFENTGYVQDFLEKLVPKDFEGNFYLCGLKEMIHEVVKILKTKSINEDRIFFEEYD